MIFFICTSHFPLFLNQVNFTISPINQLNFCFFPLIIVFLSLKFQNLAQIARFVFLNFRFQNWLFKVNLAIFACLIPLKVIFRFAHLIIRFSVYIALYPGL